MKRYMIETLILLVAATSCALVANAMAGRERKLAMVGNYGSPARTAAATGSDWVDTNETTPASPLTASFLPLEEASASDGTPAVDDAAELVQPITTGNKQPVAAAPVKTGDRKAAPAQTAVSPAPPAMTPAAPRKATREQILARFAPTPDKPYVEVSGDDVAWLHAQGALFLDARRSSIFEQGHIAGARSFSVWESDIDDKVAALLSEVSDQQMPIVVYCSGGACEDSHMLSQKLWGVFFENVLVYKDGFPDWQQRGGAVRTGAAR